MDFAELHGTLLCDRMLDETTGGQPSARWQTPKLRGHRGRPADHGLCPSAPTGCDGVLSHSRVLTCWGAASLAPLSDALRGAELGSEDEIAHESAKSCPWASSLPAPQIHYLALRSIQLSDSSLSEARLQVSGRQKPSRRPMLGTRFFC